MSHLHIVHDSDAHFTIDPITRAIINESGKVTVIQHDHNSERLTFSIQKQVEGHNMSACNRVEIHYINIDATDKTKKATGMYEADDLKTSSDDSGTVTFSWLLSRNATQYAGSLNFLIRFACITDGVEEYAWNTAIFQGITVGSGMYHGGEEVIEPYLDVIAQWKTQLFEASDTAVLNVTTAETNALAAIEAAGEAKKKSVLDSIPDEYEALQTGVDTLFNSVASGIRGNLSGYAVFADDVSPVAHSPVVRVHGKNLVPYGTITLTKNKSYLLDNPIPAGTYTISAHITSDDTDSVYSAVSINNKSEVMKYIALKRGVRVSSTFTVDKPITNIDFCAAYNYSQGEDDSATWSDIQLEEGAVATEYTPYIDPATVTVKRCGKNLISYPYMYGNKEHNGVEFTVFDNGVINMDGTSTDYAVFYVDSESIKFENGVAYDIVQPITKKAGLVLNYTDENGKSSWISSSIVWKSGYTYKGLYIQIDPDVTINENFIPIIKRTRDQLESYIPGADGNVPGVTSVSPTMTIMTDTPGVTVECEYIVDTKKYIDNKIAEALKGSELA